MNQIKTEWIYETAEETAKKIRKALKEVFPSVKFSVRSQTYSGGSSVTVSWTDLPRTEEVEEILNRFKSGSYNSMEEYYQTTGYEYEGKIYVGAKYIFANRHLSDEYKNMLEDIAREKGYNLNRNSWDYWMILNRVEEEYLNEIKRDEQTEADQIPEQDEPVERQKAEIHDNTQSDKSEQKEEKQYNRIQGKIKAEKIVFNWSESPDIPEGLTVKTFVEADEIIKRVALKNTEGGYFKTSFTIYYEDGQTYTGRIDICENDNSLTKHVLDFVECMAGIRKPVHLTDEQWKNYIKEHKADYLEFYNNYHIGDPVTCDNGSTRKVVSITDKLKVKTEEQQKQKWLKQFENLIKNLSQNEILEIAEVMSRGNKEEITDIITRYVMIAAGRQVLK